VNTENCSLSDFPESIHSHCFCRRATQAPSIAKDNGFFVSTRGAFPTAHFTLTPGPVGASTTITPIEALNLTIPHVFIQHLLDSAILNNGLLQSNLSIEKSTVYDYIRSTVAHGLVQYSHEADAYRNPDNPESSVFGLFGNSYLKSIYTLSQWREAKKLFAGDRDAMTRIFNENADKKWIPSR
jgi:hypothetical protein